MVANSSPSVLTAGGFETIGFAMMLPKKPNPGRYSNKTRLRRFKGWFGTDAKIVALTWAGLFASGWLNYARHPKPVHLLWALLFLQTYSTESILASQAGGVDEKTLRKWVWFYAEGIARLTSKVVSELSFGFASFPRHSFVLT